MFQAQAATQDAEMRDGDTQEDDTNVSSGPATDERVAGIISGPSLSFATDSGDDDDDHDADDESDIKGKSKSKAKAKGKARSKTKAKDRVKETTKMAETLQEIQAAEEAKVLKEMEEEEEANKRAEKDAENASPEEIAVIAATGIAPDDAILASPAEDEDTSVEL
jgi:hypothetical protein